jgi:hypothetical protein
VVRTSGKIYEALVALLQRRPRSNLYHSALVATSADGPVLVEMAPEFDDRGHADRGVVATGAVGAAWLRRFRVFRYEVRRWRNGVIPDLAYAIGGPIRISDDRETVRAVLELLPEVPTPVWGRDELGTGDMWNSNSVVSWALASFGLEARAGSPPGGGRAPGWTAGVVVARRKAGSAADSVVNRVGGHRTAR